MRGTESNDTKEVVEKIPEHFRRTQTQRYHPKKSRNSAEHNALAHGVDDMSHSVATCGPICTLNVRHDNMGIVVNHQSDTHCETYS